MTETVFDNRFQHVSELRRMGISITVKNNVAEVDGNGQLRGCSNLKVTDIRAGACMVLAALGAEGTSLINDTNGHIDRGYSNFILKLKACGANIEIVNEKCEK